MKFATTYSLGALISIAAAGTSFGLVTIRSGSDLQYNSVAASGSNFIASTGNSGVTFVLNSDGSLVDTNSKKYVGINADKQVVQVDTAVKEFSFVDESNLAYKGEEVFAVASDKKLTIDEGTGVALLAVSKKDSPDVHPGDKTTSIPVPKPTTPAPKTTTSVHKTTITTTDCVSTTKPSTPPHHGSGTRFGVVAIASGTKFQYSAIKKVDSHPHVFAVGGSEGKDLVLTLKSDGTLVDQDGRGVNHDSQTGELGSVAPFGREAPTPGFSIQDGHLVLNGKDNWKACPSGDDKYSLANNDCIGGTGIALRAVDETEV